MPGSRDHLEKLASAFTEARVLLTAAELDIFTIIGTGARSAVETAELIGAAEAPLERLLNALVAMKILTKKQGFFRNGAAAKRHLMSDSPEPLGDIMRHRARMWESWSHLTGVVQTGEVPVRTKSPASTEQFIKGMNNIAVVSAEETVDLLASELESARRVLDLGGGPGTYACAFARRFPHLKVAVFDLPDALDIARQVVRAERLQSRVRLKPGDVLEAASLGRGFDLVFLSNFVHCFKPDAAEVVIRKAASAARRGGCVAIKDFCLESEGTAPRFAALFSINMLMADAGDSYPLTRLKSWMKNAGLSGFKVKGLAKNSTLVVAARS